MIKTKDIVKCVDTKNLRDKADCFQRGDDWYEVEPKWDRRVKAYVGYHIDPINGNGFNTKWEFYKELEVTEDGEPIGYVGKEVVDNYKLYGKRLLDI